MNPDAPASAMKTSKIKSAWGLKLTLRRHHEHLGRGVQSVNQTETKMKTAWYITYLRLTCLGANDAGKLTTTIVNWCFNYWFTYALQRAIKKQWTLKLTVALPGLPQSVDPREIWQLIPELNANPWRVCLNGKNTSSKKNQADQT